MKRLLVAAFACLLGFGTAWAAVEGNNTAVVVRKAPVVSKTDYQFIGLPVRGFDITGQGKSQTLPLADVLPPASYPAGAIPGACQRHLHGHWHGRDCQMVSGWWRDRRRHVWCGQWRGSLAEDRLGYSCGDELVLFGRHPCRQGERGSRARCG